MRQLSGSLLIIGLSVATVGRAAEPRVCSATACTGDCNQSGTVTVDELLRGVNMALGVIPPSDCPAFDTEGDEAPSVAQLTKAVQRLLRGCEPPLERQPETLVNHTSWVVASDADDLFVGMRPAGATCTPGSYRFEILAGEQSLEVKTQDCSYLTVRQPIQVAVRKGDELYIRLWHFALTAPARAVAYMAVAFGDCVVWEERRRIPTGSELHVARIPAPSALPAGTPVSFHVQNHGENSYHLVEISVGGSLLDDGN